MNRTSGHRTALRAAPGGRQRGDMDPHPVTPAAPSKACAIFRRLSTGGYRPIATMPSHQWRERLCNDNK